MVPIIYRMWFSCEINTAMKFQWCEGSKWLLRATDMSYIGDYRQHMHCGASIQHAHQIQLIYFAGWWRFTHEMANELYLLLPLKSKWNSLIIALVQWQKINWTFLKHQENLNCHIIYWQKSQCLLFTSYVEEKKGNTGKDVCVTIVLAGVRCCGSAYHVAVPFKGHCIIISRFKVPKQGPRRSRTWDQDTKVTIDHLQWYWGNMYMGTGKIWKGRVSVTVSVLPR